MSLSRTPLVAPWQKACPRCATIVTNYTAVPHIGAMHGIRFRLSALQQARGMPESTFDEAMAFMDRLRRAEVTGL